MPDVMIMNTLIFIAVVAIVFAFRSIVRQIDPRMEHRLEEINKSKSLSDTTSKPSNIKRIATQTLPKVGNIIIPTSDDERTLLQNRLVQAGFYSRNALHLFLATKFLFIVVPTVISLAFVVGLGLPRKVLLYPAILGIFGMIGPSFYLDRLKSKRQIRFRRALPDALDLLVVCVEGGLSLPASIKRIAMELRTAHPELSCEFNLVQKQVQMGMTPGEALEQLGFRSDLEEIKQLASVVNQSERFGASISKSLRVAGETLRVRRQQHAEELAQKAAVKILIPTLLFIFPSIFVVILGPAMYQIFEMFESMN